MYAPPAVVSIVVIDGFTKKTSPGSLLQPAATYMFPANWLTLPLSFGLLMSPWGGHSVFPNVGESPRSTLPALDPYMRCCANFSMADLS